MNKEWVSLHNHTMYSLLDGCGRITDFVSYAKQCNFKSLAITDHGTCAGFLDFQALCLEAGIKPIFGLECYISPFEMTLKGITEEEDFTKEDRKKEIKSRSRNSHLVFLAKDSQGIKSLYNIITAANMIGYYRRPRIDHDFLAKNSAGLICTTACLGSRLNSFILENDDKGIEKEIDFLKNTFKEDLYLELEANYMAEQKIVNKKLIELSKKYNITKKGNAINIIIITIFVINIIFLFFILTPHYPFNFSSFFYIFKISLLSRFLRFCWLFFIIVIIIRA